MSLFKHQAMMITKIVDNCSVVHAQGVSMASWMQWPAQVGSIVCAQYSVLVWLVHTLSSNSTAGHVSPAYTKGLSVSDSCQSA